MENRLESCTIYVITNTANNKKYIGQTWKTIQKRWQQHCTDEKNCIKYGKRVWMEV